MMQMYIEGKPIDVSEVFSTLLTAAIDDIRNFGKRETTFSKTVIVPATKRNNVAFGNIFNATVRNDYTPSLPNYGTNFNAAVSARVLVMQDNMQQLKGTARLLQINVLNGQPIDYELALVGELGGFNAKLAALKISDLDFSAYDHEYSIANITGSWANDNAGSGYYYPLIDYGNYSTNKKDWKVGTFRPAIFLKEVLEKIVEGAGYTMDFPLLSTDRFKRLIVPYNRKILTANNTRVLTQSTTTHTINDVNNIEQVEFDGSGGTLGAFTTGDFITFTYSPVGGATTLTVAVKITINIISYTAFPDVIYLQFRKNATSYYEVAVNGAGTYTINLPAVTFSPTDTFSFRIRSIILGETLQYSVSMKMDSNVAVPTAVLIGDDVKMNDALPQNILQRDFVAWLLKLFNLYVTEDTNTDKKLIVKPYIDFYDGSIENWNSKVDWGSNMILKPMSELNARYYNFKFKQDSDYWNEVYRKRYNEGYGDRIYDSSFEFSNEKIDVEIGFSSTPLVGYSGEDKVYSTIFKRTGNEPSVTEESIDSNIRILIAKKITGVASWKIRNQEDSGDLHTGTVFPYAGHLDDPYTPANDINFGAPKEVFFPLSAGTLSVNQFNVYWSPYMAEITDKDSKLMTCTLRLTGMDWYNLDFAKLKYIDGSLWRLNKIIDYNASTEDTCKGEFIKLIEKEY